jgi:transposase InsO family protein
VLDRCENVLGSDLKKTFPKAGRLEILPEHGRMSRRKLDTDRGHRSSAQTFQAQCARACEQLKDSRAGHPRSQAVENRLFYQVRRRPKVQALGHLKPLPSRLSACNPHSLNITAGRPVS